MSSLSKDYVVRKLTEDDIEAIYALCRGNTFYYKYAPPLVTRRSIAEDLKAVPPGKELRDKYFLGYYEGSKLMAVLDLIRGYPTEDTAFIGFFMTDSSIQKQGIGSSIIKQLCAYLKSKGFSHVRLAWVKDNPQSEHFWHKNDFVKTGEISEQALYTVVLAQRSL